LLGRPLGPSLDPAQGISMPHADANTLLRYTHVEPDPLADLLPLLP
jgi:hypothetical protein